MNIAGRIGRKIFNALPPNLQHIARWNRLFFSSVTEPFTAHPHRIIIDITTACDISCVDCNRSCAVNQAPAREHMTPDQIRRFIAESIRSGRVWCGSAGEPEPGQNGIRISGGDPACEGMRIEGGEPTQNPYFFEILELLADYKANTAPQTTIILCSNGHSRQTRQRLDTVPPGVVVYNSDKQVRGHSQHCAFNVAPIDSRAFRNHDFSNGCWLPLYYGIGLTQHGYYPHPICGGIDRVLGFDIGLKSLPPSDYSWREHYRTLCRYCGHYNRYCPEGPVRYASSAREQGRMSAFWQKAYAEYCIKKPVLTRY